MWLPASPPAREMLVWGDPLPLASENQRVGVCTGARVSVYAGCLPRNTWAEHLANKGRRNLAQGRWHAWDQWAWEGSSRAGSHKPNCATPRGWNLSCSQER